MKENKSVKFKLSIKQILFLVFCFSIGGCLGFFASPNKFEGNITCTFAEVSDDYHTTIANNIISSDHIDQLIERSGYKGVLSYSDVRSSIGLHLEAGSTYFGLSFSFDSKNTTEAFVESFKSFSINYLNSKIPKMKNSISFYNLEMKSIKTLPYAIISSGGCALFMLISTYTLLVWYNNKDGNHDK